MFICGGFVCVLFGWAGWGVVGVVGGWGVVGVSLTLIFVKAIICFGIPRRQKNEEFFFCF